MSKKRSFFSLSARVLSATETELRFRVPEQTTEYRQVVFLWTELTQQLQALCRLHSIHYVFFRFAPLRCYNLLTCQQGVRRQGGHSERCHQHSLNCRLRNHLGLDNGRLHKPSVVIGIVIGIDKVIEETALDSSVASCVDETIFAASDWSVVVSVLLASSYPFESFCADLWNIGCRFEYVSWRVRLIWYCTRVVWMNPGCPESTLEVIWHHCFTLLYFICKDDITSKLTQLKIFSQQFLFSLI